MNQAVIHYLEIQKMQNIRNTKSSVLKTKKYKTFCTLLGVSDMSFLFAYHKNGI